jgi:hypothetical protein
MSTAAHSGEIAKYVPLNLCESVAAENDVADPAGKENPTFGPRNGR